MKAVVTGGAGFIGSHLVDRLAADGLDVHVIDDFRSGDYIAPHATVHPMSVRNATYSAWAGASIIYHLASPVGPVGVLHKAGRIAAEVMADAEWVAGMARRAGIPLVYVSTSELYGPQTGACDESLNAVITPDASPRKEYAVAKLAAEVMLRNTAGLDVRIVRPFNVAGPRQKPDGGFVLPRFIGQALRGEPLTVYAPGTQVRAFSHVADIVDGLIAVAARGQAGDVFNLGNADNRTTISELAGLVLEVVNPNGTAVLVDPQALWGSAFREAADKYPDATHAEQTIGWRATRGLRTVVEDTAREMGA